MRAVTDTEVAAYAGLIKSLASKTLGYSDAEYEDLYQEGMIAVWLTLAHDHRVHKDVVRGRMLNYCRYLRRLHNNDAIAYEELLPMEHHAIDEL